MERPAKERLIGAVVIVTVAWLLIPVFLDEGGRDGDAVIARQLDLPDPESGSGVKIRRETVTLDDQPAGTAVRETPAPAPVTALPVPGAPADETAAAPPESDGRSATTPATDTGEVSAREAERPPETQAEPVAAEPETATRRDPEPKDRAPAPPVETASDRAAAGATQLWAVQLGSFSDRDNAQRLAGQLREQGYPAFLSQVEAAGRTMHRVRVGPQSSREAAAEVAARLSGAGQSATVVRHP